MPDNDFLNLEDLEELELDEETDLDDTDDEELDDDEPETEEGYEDDDTDEDADEDPEEEEGLSKGSRKIDPKVMKELTEYPELIREDIARWPDDKRKALKLMHNRMNSRVLRTESDIKQQMQERADNEEAAKVVLSKLKESLKNGGVDEKIAESIQRTALEVATASYAKYEQGLAKLAEKELVPIMEDYLLNVGEDLMEFHKQHPLMSRGLFAILRYTDPKKRNKVLAMFKPAVQEILKRSGKPKRKGGKPSSRKPKRNADDFESVRDGMLKLFEKE